MAVEYRDEGIGQVLLLLHGWRDNLHTFDLLALLLSPNHRVVRLDLPGFGESEMPRTAWYLSDYAGFVRDFLAKLGLHADVIAGHSFGGRVTIKGIAEHFFEAKKIVLIASAGVAERSTPRALFFLALAKLGRLVTAVPPFMLLRGTLRQYLYRRAGNSDYLSAGPLKQIYLNIIGEDLSDAAKTINRPTLLIWGSADTETPLREGQRLETLIPNTTLEILSGAGHFLHREKPQEVAELIRKFLS